MDISQAEKQMDVEIEEKAKVLKDKFNPEEYVFVVPLNTYELYLGKYHRENYHLFLFYKKVRIFWSSRIYRDDYVALITKDDYNLIYNPCDFVKVI